MWWLKSRERKRDVMNFCTCLCKLCISSWGETDAAARTAKFGWFTRKTDFVRNNIVFLYWGLIFIVISVSITSLSDVFFCEPFWSPLSFENINNSDRTTCQLFGITTSLHRSAWSRLCFTGHFHASELCVRECLGKKKRCDLLVWKQAISIF